MRKTVSVISAVIFLVMGQAWASQVTKVSLQSQKDGYTVVRIGVQGTVRFTHQTEQAKDGKPFRVIVDVLSATHQLPTKNFLSLPECPVQKIRTSQYAVKPEKIVRMVFDMEEETVYRVDSDDSSITLYFPDKHHRQFSNWSSSIWAEASKASQEITSTKSQPTAEAVTGRANQPKKSVVEINKAIDKDRLLSLAEEPSSVPTTSKAGEKKPALVLDKQKPAFSKNSPSGNSAAVQAAHGIPAGRLDLPYGPQIDSSQFEPPTSQPLVEASGVSKGVTKETSTVDREQPGAKEATAAPVKKQLALNEKLATSATAAKTAPPEDTKKAKLSSQKSSTATPQIASTEPEGKKASLRKQIVPQPPVVKQGESELATPQVPVKVEKPVSGQLAANVQKQPKATASASKEPAVNKAHDETGQSVLTSSSPSAQPVSSASAKNKVTESTSKAANKDQTSSRQDSTATLKDQKSTSKKKSTSRFRRSPTQPTKIKGTLVAEFPKRLVIKYKAKGYRDPFETLINEGKKYNNPIEQRVPNVEGLRLVGVLESEAGVNSALFEDKEGYGYILKEGDKVQKGYVLRIEHEKVYFQIFEYGWSRTLALNIDED